jgi:hypothetical protein
MLKGKTMKKTLIILGFSAMAALAGTAYAQVPVYRTVAYPATAPVVIRSAPIVAVAPVVVQAAPAVIYQRPVYVTPAPVYVVPPAISFGFGGCRPGFGAYLPGIGFRFSFGHSHHSRHCW